MEKLKSWARSLVKPAQSGWRNLSSFSRELWAEVVRPEDPEKRDLIVFLRQVELFGEMKRDSNFRALADFLHRRQYSKDEVIFSESDPASALYLVKQGTVELGSPGDASRPSSQFEEAESFGELALCLEHRRFREARALSPVTLYVLFRKDFIRFVTRNRSCGLRLLFDLTSRIARQLQEERKQNFKLQQELEELTE